MVCGSTTHPTAEQLRDFGSGRLSPVEAAPIEQHLLGCDRCCAVLENSPADRFVERLGLVYAPLAIATEVNVLGPLVEPVNEVGDGTQPSLNEDLPPDLVRQSRYRVVRLLGKGGMGSVYLAEHRRMGRPVALKVIDPQLLRHDGALKRFQQEVRAAAQLHHAHIVAAYDADQAGDLHFLVMEYVEGQNLADYLAEHGPLDVAQACDVARQAALGLHHAHERGMVHRDIKPHNLMRVPSGQVKVLDFGLARLVAEPGATGAADHTPTLLHLTGAGAVMGTADYIAPEQARDAHGADACADVYSLGCTLYHLLAGWPPFPGGTVAEKLARHAAEEPPPLPALRPEVPPGLAAIVGRMMAKKPQDRFPTAIAAAEALRPYADAVPPVKQPRRRLAPAALVALAAVLLATAVAAVVIRLSAGNGREIVIETDDPEIGVIVKGDRIVRIVDPKTGKAYQLDRADLTLALADEPGGLQVALDGGAPVVLKRRGRRVAVVRTAGQPPPGGEEPSKQADEGRGPVREEKVDEVRRFAGHTFNADAENVGEVRHFGEPGVAGRVYFLPHRGRAVSSGTVFRLWDVRTGQKVRDIAEKIGWCGWGTAVSPDGRHALIGHHLCDLETGTELRTVELPIPNVWGVAFSPDGRRAVLGGHAPLGAGATTVWVVDVDSGKLVQRLGTGESARQVAYSPDGTRIAVGHYFTSDHVRSVIRVYDTATGKALRHLNVPSVAPSLMFSHDGKRLLSAVGATLRLWDLEGGKQLRQFEGHVDGVEWAVFTPDEGRIVSAGADKTVRVWEASSGKQLHCYLGHRGGVVGVAVSPDGRFALSSGKDDTLRLWRLPPPSPASWAKNPPPQTGKAAVPLRLEAEDLAFSTRHCNARKQEMETRGQDRWSHGGHLLCTGEMGSELVLPFRVAQAGDYELVLHATRAPGYGQFQIWLNGHRVGPVIDACHTRLEPTGPIALGVCSLESGSQEMRFELVGKNPASSNSLFGIDCLDLVPADAPTTKAEP